MRGAQIWYIVHPQFFSCSGPTAAASIENFKQHIDGRVMTRSCAPKVRVKDAFDNDVMGVYQGMRSKDCTIAFGVTLHTILHVLC